MNTNNKDLFPTRQRCKTCRKKLDEIVIAGQYCSYRCGHFPSPSKTIEDAPRGCKRENNGKWEYKVRYKSPDVVPAKWHNDPSTNIYLCDNCRMYHIGHSRPDSTQIAEFSRYVKTQKELGSVLKRQREQLGIERKWLAEKLKVPMIRITELENGDKDASLEVLIKLLPLIKLQITLTTW